jgi:hypothetical protein
MVPTQDVLQLGVRYEHWIILVEVLALFPLALNIAESRVDIGWSRKVCLNIKSESSKTSNVNAFALELLLMNEFYCSFPYD